LNGDGKADLVVASLFSSTSVAVLLGNGDGTFQAPLNFVAGSGSRSVAVGDFNGDGKKDLAVANFDSDTVSVLVGNGDGTFRVAGTVLAHFHPSSLAVADFNGDHLPDLAVTNFDSGDVSVLLGNADGTLQAASGATTLSVIPDGTGSGTVTSAESPPRITCRPSCTVSYLFGTPVTLTATASTGSVFTGWRVIGADACAGTGPCTVTITGTTFVFATFVPQAGVTLAVSKAGTGSGRVVSNPGGINCGATCSVIFGSGAVVVLTAVVDPGSTFTSWSGCDTVSNNKCTVTLT